MVHHLVNLYKFTSSTTEGEITFPSASLIYSRFPPSVTFNVQVVSPLAYPSAASVSSNIYSPDANVTLFSDPLDQII